MNFRLLSAMFTIMILTAIPAFAQEVDETGGEDVTAPRSRWSFVVTGLGVFSQEIANSSEKYDLFNLGFGFQYDVNSSFAMRIEALPVLHASGVEEGIEDIDGYGWVGTLLYYFGEPGATRLYGEFNAGMGLYNEAIPTPSSTKFNYLLGLGAGVDLAASERVSVILGYRFFHVSNSGLGARNPAINGHGILLGLRFGF